MSKLVEEVDDNIVGKGGMLALLYFDVHGKSPEIIQNSLVEMIGRMTQEFGVVYARGEIEKPIEYEGMHSTSAEVRILVRDLNTMVNICFRYGPIGVDVLRPNEMKISIPTLHQILLNISQTSQEYTKLVCDRVMTPEEREDFNKQLIKRAEIAKKLIEKGKAAKSI